MRWVLVTLALVGGCFADPPGIAGSETTGAPACPVGSSGCPCTGGGTCDGMLECHAPSGLCFDPDCDRGSENCPCADGLCLQGLVCTDGYCAAPMAGTTGTVDGGTQTGASTGTTGVLPMTMSGELDSDPTLLTESAELGTISDTTTLGEPDPMACAGCVQLATEAACGPTVTTCKGDDNCNMHADCVLLNGTGEACCSQYGPNSKWDPVATCFEAACSAVCDHLTC